MNNFKLETARGVRDIPPTEQLLREHVQSIITKNFRLFGFQPLDTPIIERFDVLGAKFAAGEESDAMKETYRLQDNGGRELALRFDLTVPLSRYVGMNKNMPLPFARYQVGKVYRDAPVRKGRYREFTQCDADIIGTDSLLADATCIQLALAVYTELGIDVTIKVNNRKFLNAILYSFGIDDVKAASVLVTLDKLDKIGRDGVLKELEQKMIGPREEIMNLLLMQGSTQEKINYFRSHQCDAKGIDELYELFSYLDDNRVVFEPTLARGLGYYTGTIFEIEAKELDSSIGAGGRYDNLIDEYLKAANISSNRSYPGVGISFGLDRIVDVVKTLGKNDIQTQATQVLLVPMETNKEVMQLATQLRAAGIQTAVDMSGKKLGKVFAAADEANIPFVAVVGENEVANNTLTVKNLKTGEQEELSVEQTIDKVWQ